MDFASAIGQDPMPTLQDALRTKFIWFFLFFVLLSIYPLIVRMLKDLRLEQAGLPEIDRLDGREYEHYLKLLFQRNGYKVELTPASNDFGADLIVERDGYRIAIQPKMRGNQKGAKS